MYTKAWNSYEDRNFNFSLGTALGTSGYEIPSQTKSVLLTKTADPIERIELIFTFKTNASASAFSGPQITPNGFADVVKNVRLLRTKSDGTPFTQVDCSGAQLIKWAIQNAGFCDPDTLKATFAMGGKAMPLQANTTYTLRVPICGTPNVEDPYWSFFLIPHNLDQQEAKLEVTLDTTTNVISGQQSGYGSIASLDVDIRVTYRVANIRNDGSTLWDDIVSAGGFLPWELIQVNQFIPPGTAAVGVEIPGPGKVLGVLLETFSNNSATPGTRALGLPGAARAAWEFRIAQQAIAGGKLKLEDLASVNRMSIPSLNLVTNSQPGGTAVGSATFNATNANSTVFTNYTSGGAAPLTIAVPTYAGVIDCFPPGMYYLDRITDGSLDASGDFGSVLDLPAGLKTTVFGTFSSTSTQMNVVILRVNDSLAPSRFRAPQKAAGK